ncbi:MAG: serine/threonine-protein kinase [Acidobacteriota bacterium]
MSVASRSIGPYRIVRALGKGGMGVVYEAEDAGGARVALKTLHLPSMEMAGTIRREIQSLARLSHPGIVRIVDHGDHEGLPWYAMELFRGATLREYMRGARATLSTSPRSGGDATQGQVTRIAASPTVPDAMLDAETARYGRGAGSEPPHLDPAAAGRERPIGEILTIVARLCAPLAYLHGAGIVHRDLKPENVVLKDGAAPVLVDFGLASPWSGDVARDTLDTTGGVAGTASYMSPEQWRGEIVDARTDLYALGCILHELLTGAPPFVAASAPEMLALHLHAPPAPASRVASGVVPELDALVLGRSQRMRASGLAMPRTSPRPSRRSARPCLRTERPGPIFTGRRSPDGRWS